MLAGRRGAKHRAPGLGLADPERPARPPPDLPRRRRGYATSPGRRVKEEAAGSLSSGTCRYPPSPGLRVSLLPAR